MRLTARRRRVEYELVTTDSNTIFFLLFSFEAALNQQIISILKPCTPCVILSSDLSKDFNIFFFISYPPCYNMFNPRLCERMDMACLTIVLDSLWLSEEFFEIL